MTFGHYNSWLTILFFIIIFSEWWFGYNIPIKLIILSLKRKHWKLKLLDVLTSKFWGFEFDLRPSEVNSGQKYFCCLRTHFYNFLSHVYWHFLSRSVFETFDIEVFHWHFLSISFSFRYIRFQSFQGLTLTFDLRTVFEIFYFNVFRVWPWPLTS